MERVKKMPKVLPDINYEEEKGNATIDSSNSLYNIPMFKPIEYFANIESRNNFIKATEKLVRTNDRYSKYISYLKGKVKLNHCQVLHNITDEDCAIEMHHGPIFTLYDYCDIVLNYYISKNWKISTFRIADTVLNEHIKNRVHVVMLSPTVHEEVHLREIFINIQQAWGDLHAFLKKYGKVLTNDQIDKYNRYLDKSMMMDTNTYDILKLNERLVKK